MSGDEGGIAGSSLAGRRKKFDCVDVLTGVPPTSSTAGDMLLMKASLWPARGPVDGTKCPTLEGGMRSSMLSRGRSASVSDLAAKTSLKRLFAGVAFTWIEELRQH